MCSGQDPPCFGNPKTHAGPHHGLCQPLDFQAHPGFVESGKTHDPRRVRGRSCCHHGDGHAWLAGLERAGAGHNVSCHGQRPGPMRALESAPPDSARPLALGLHPEKARCTPVPATLATLHCAHAGLGSTRAATGLTSATSFTSSSTTSSSRSAWVFFGWGERGGGRGGGGPTNQLQWSARSPAGCGPSDPRPAHTSPPRRTRNLVGPRRVHCSSSSMLRDKRRPRKRMAAFPASLVRASLAGHPNELQPGHAYSTRPCHCGTARGDLPCRHGPFRIETPLVPPPPLWAPCRRV